MISSSTPFSPFSIPADSSCSSPLLIPENLEHPQTVFSLTAVDDEIEFVT